LGQFPNCRQLARNISSATVQTEDPVMAPLSELRSKIADAHHLSHQRDLIVGVDE
jgi:hypothetical protein